MRPEYCIKRPRENGPASNRKGYSMRSAIWILVAVLLVAAGPALAGGGDKGDWELGIYGGYGWLDEYGIFRPENGFLYGARIGYFLSPQWSLEFSGQRMNTDTEFEILGVEDVDVHLGALRLNALYNLGEAGQRFRPFLTGGAGYEKFDVDDYGESCDFGWNAGAGLRWFLSPGWNLRLDGRYVRTKVGDEVDESQGNVEATLGLGLLFGGGGGEEVRADQSPPNQPPTVSCASDRPEVLPGESVNIRASASDPEGDPLTYAWSATAGRVTGTGAAAALDFASTTPPASATVTVRVTDNHGNTAASDCTVRLLEPARRAEAVSCIAGGFQSNRSHLTNVDKACLDDVAQRLKGDPRARVIVIGHADTRETAADVGQQRADAVRDYLVTDRGIEASRTTTRSAGATKPLSTGTDAGAQASNRRVEVWFVPEGATVPE